VTYTATAARALRRHANRAPAIRAKIDQLAEDPASQANNVKALKGVDAKRLRVGEFRVIFQEDGDTLLVLDIGPRGSVYD
jgi:mRNA interferase RelE/StbE